MPQIIQRSKTDFKSSFYCKVSQDTLYLVADPVLLHSERVEIVFMCCIVHYIPSFTYFSRTWALFLSYTGYSVQNSLQCTEQVTVYNAVYNVQYSLQCTEQFTLYKTVFSVQNSLQYTVPFTVYSTVYSVQNSIQCTVQYTVYSTVYSVQNSFSVQNSLQCTINFTQCAVRFSSAQFAQYS